MKKVMVMVGILFVFGINFYGAVSVNWGCTPLLPNGCQTCNGSGGISEIKNGSSNGPSIGQLIATGTHHYCKANSIYQEFLSQIELGENNGVYNYPLLKKMIEKSISYLTVARESYAAADNIAQNCSLDENFMLKIKGFDFEAFQQNNNLIPSIFETAKYYLTKNITGIYGKMATNTANILIMLQNIKGQIDKKSTPEFSLIWECNQVFYETHLFGQYISMVIYSLMNE
jgi:hypothetical protein